MSRLREKQQDIVRAQQLGMRLFAEFGNSFASDCPPIERGWVARIVWAAAKRAVRMSDSCGYDRLQWKARLLNWSELRRASDNGYRVRVGQDYPLCGPVGRLP